MSAELFGSIALEVARLHLRAERIARRDLLEANHRADVACAQLVHLGAVVCEEADDLHDALALLRAGVVRVSALLEDASVDAHEEEPSDERIGRDLEDEGGKELGVLLPARDLLLALEVRRLDRRTVRRRGEVGAYRVEERLHALVLEGASAQHRHERARDRRAAQRGHELLGGEVALLEERLHHAFVYVRDLLDELRASELRVVLHVGRDLAHRESLPLVGIVVLPHDGLHVDEIDDAFEAVLASDRELDGACVRPELLAELSDDALEVRAHAVHLVDERDSRNVVAVRLAPDGLGLRLHAADGAEDAHRSVEHAQRALDLHREVDVSGSVDDVDVVSAPLAGDRGGLYRDAVLLLLHHEVRRRVRVVDIACVVDLSGVEEDAFGGGRLARVDVGDDSDVSNVGQL